VNPGVAVPHARVGARVVGPVWIAFSFFVGVLGAVPYFVLAWALEFFGRATLAVSIYAAICIVALAAWLSVGGRWSRRLDGFLAGVLSSAVVFAIPIVLAGLALCASFLGLVVALVVLLIPAVCIWIYGRNAMRAFESAGGATRRSATYFAGLVAAPLITGTLLVVAIRGSDLALNRLLSEDPDSAEPWIAVCAPLIGRVPLRGWQEAYDDEIATNTPESLARAERISAAHGRITGVSLPPDDSAFAGHH
jgi:hypothetical protein